MTYSTIAMSLDTNFAARNSLEMTLVIKHKVTSSGFAKQNCIEKHPYV